MALIDVSFLTYDPDFADTFDVIRATKDVDADGVTLTSSAPITGVTGSVQPASDRTMQRLPDGTRVASTIDIWTTFPLTSGLEGQDADQVLYLGAIYVITDVTDWSRYGRGFIKAQGEMTDLRPRAI